MVTARVHSYYAESHALSGQVKYNIKPSAQVFLIGEGDGGCSGAVNGISIEDVVTIDSAKTEVTGKKLASGEWVTTASCEINGLTIFDVEKKAAVTADRIAVQMTSTHPANGYVPKVEFAPAFVNLVIGGAAVRPTYKLDICGQPKEPTVPKDPGAKPYLIEFLRDQTFVGNVANQDQAIANNGKAPAWARNKFNRDQSNKSKMVCSLVTDTGLAAPQAFGHVVEVPGVGRVFLAELTVADHFELNMLRVELCELSDGAFLIIGGPSHNGNTRP